MQDQTRTEEPDARVFPRWLSRRVPILAELESNPLYLFFTGHAFGKRRWWRVGGRPGGFRLGDPRFLRRILIFFCFAGAFLAFTVFGFGGMVSIGFLLLLFASVGALFAGPAGSVKDFLEREHKAGRLESLALTPQTSRDWAVAWLGTRLLLRPGLYAALLIGVVLFWPVFSLYIRHTEPLLRQNLPFMDFVVYPSLAAPGFLLVALFFRVGSEILALYFELTSFVQTDGSGSRVAESIGSSFGQFLYAALAWGLPILFGLMGRAMGQLLLAIVVGNSEFFQIPIQYAGFGVGYVAGSCLMQLSVIRTYWRGARKVFLPSFREYLFRLEEEKGEARRSELPFVRFE